MFSFASQTAYNMVYPFPAGTSSTSIAATSGSGSTQVRRQRDGWFFIGTHITGTCYAYAAGTTWLAGTPLIDIADPSPPATIGNSVPSTSLVTMQFKINENFDSDTPYTWLGNVGSGRHPLVLGVPVVIPPNSDSQFQIFNASSIAIAGSLTLKGFLVQANEYRAYIQKVTGRPSSY